MYISSGAKGLSDLEAPALLLGQALLSENVDRLPIVDPYKHTNAFATFMNSMAISTKRSSVAFDSFSMMSYEANRSPD